MEGYENLTTNELYVHEETMMWKYAMILIDHPSVEEGFCELVELYIDENDMPMAFCKARIHSMEELNMAYSDASSSGINSYFSLNGTFSIDDEDGFWDWSKDGTEKPSEADDELYAIYGGD